MTQTTEYYVVTKRSYRWSLGAIFAVGLVVGFLAGHLL